MADFTIKVDGTQGLGPKTPSSPGGGAAPVRPPVLPRVVLPAQLPGAGSAKGSAKKVVSAGISGMAGIFKGIKLGVIVTAAKYVVDKLVVVAKLLKEAVTKAEVMTRGMRKQAGSYIDQFKKFMFGKKEPAEPKNWFEKMFAKFNSAMNSEGGRFARGLGGDALSASGRYGGFVRGVASRLGGIASKVGKAALSNPVTAVIAAAAAAVVGLAVAAGLAVVALKKMFDMADQTTKQLAQYSPVLRGIVRQMEVQEMLRQRRRAEVLAPSLKTVAEARSRFNAQWAELKLSLEENFYTIVAALSPLLDIAALSVRALAELIKISTAVNKTAMTAISTFFSTLSPHLGAIIAIISWLVDLSGKDLGEDPDVTSLLDAGFGAYNKTTMSIPII